MKKSNKFINESVFNVNLTYTRLQNKTKELFFECLDNGESLEYFSEQLNAIWGKFDHSFMEDEIEEYKEIIHDNNMQLMEIEEEKPVEEAKKENKFLKLVGIAVVTSYAAKLVKQKKKEYNRSLSSPAYQNDKKEYLKLKVQRYTDSIVPYYVKKTGKVRHVPLNVYASMVHNTNMTYSAWNQTLADADAYGYKYFIIPYHSFSCPHCREHQDRLMSRFTVENVIGVVAEEQSGDILHPNCKCNLIPVKSATEANRLKGIGDYLTDEEKDEIYIIRQKTNTLTLKKERLKTDIKIQNELGNQDEVDKLNQQRNKINKSIRELKQELPTRELQKQVVAINRNYNSSYYDQ